MNLIPIIIPFYKEAEKLKKCISAINAQLYQPTEIFIRDNTDDNILFTAAINEGLKKYSFNPDVKYLLILNQDCYLRTDTLTSLVECLDKNPRCGIACSIQVDQSNQVTWGGSYDAFPAGVHKMDPLNSYTQDFDTYWANGACMLLRHEMVKEIGLLDENMKFICSDSDYSFTARSRGWSVMVVAKSIAEHSLSSSGSVGSEAISSRKKLDVIYFAKKWLTGELYNELSCEGGTLSRLRIKSIIDNLKSTPRPNSSTLFL